MKYTLADTEENGHVTAAEVDDVRLEKGGESQELTEEQAKRLQDSGVQLTAEDGSTPWTPPGSELAGGNDDDKEGDV